MSGTVFDSGKSGGDTIRFRTVCSAGGSNDTVTAIGCGSLIGETVRREGSATTCSSRDAISPSFRKRLSAEPLLILIVCAGDSNRIPF